MGVPQLTSHQGLCMAAYIFGPGEMNVSCSRTVFMLLSFFSMWFWIVTLPF